MDYGRESIADALAAQYVAGTLRGGARRRFEALLPGHPALRRALARWQARLLPLTAAVTPEPAPAAVWPAIERRLWPEPERQPWWQALGFWRTASALTSVAAVGFALLLANPAPQPAPVVVVLAATGAEGAPQARNVSFVASVSGDGRIRRSLRPKSAEPSRVTSK